jgi:hypothetical protein
MDDFDLETRFIHREETFTDHAIEELAQIKAACMCRIQYGSCKEHHCKQCKLHSYVEECTQNMSAYDKARVKSHIGKYYILYSSKPESWLSMFGILARLLRIIVVTSVSIGLILLLVYCFF